MNKLAKILTGTWGVLALVSFISAFFAPLYFKIIGIVFGVLNLMIILAWVITYLQDLFIKKNIDNGTFMQLQEEDKEETYTEETSGE